MMNRIRRVAGRVVSGDPTVYPQIRDYLRAVVTRRARRTQSRFENKTAELRTSIKADRLRRGERGQLLLVNADYYGQQAGQAFADAQSAFAHYCEQGWQQGLDPHPLFLTQYYTKAAGDLDGLDPVTHYLKHGSRAGHNPHPLVDLEYYRKTYPWTAHMDPLVHFLSDGFAERHNPNPFFDTDAYLQRHIDQLDGLDPLSHYVLLGEPLRFNPHPLIDTHMLSTQFGEPLSATATAGTDTAHRRPTLLEQFIHSVAPINSHPRFNAKYYSRGMVRAGLLPEQDAPLSGQAALLHFLDPKTPRIDPAAGFSEILYADMYPDIGNMIGLYHFERYGEREGRSAFSSAARPNNAELRAALAIEPDIIAPHQDISRATLVSTPRMKDPFVGALVDMVFRIGAVRPDIVLLLHGYVRGGAERYASKLSHELAALHPDKSILVLGTDDGAVETQGWFDGPDGVTVLSFGPQQLALDLRVRTRLLANILMWLSPDVVINCNSHTGWEAYRSFGRSLKRASRLMATLFCYDLDARGRPVGYARDYVRPTIEHIDTFLVDNAAFIDTLMEDFSLGAHNRERFAVVHQPFAATVPAPTTATEPAPASESGSENHAADGRKDAGPRYVWAARFSTQKRPDRLRRIAEAMPDAAFTVWSTEGWNRDLAGGRKPANVEIVTEQAGLASIAARGFDAFLLTSDWEGLPTTLIEATHLGLPIVSTRVGGVTDLINPKRGWLVDVDDREEDAIETDLVAALRDVSGHPDRAAAKVEAARRHLARNFSSAAYRRALKSINLTGSLTERRLDTAIPARPAAKMPRRRKTSIDVTLVVNAHREGHYLLPTLKACEAALAACREAGLDVEMLIAIDNPDAATLDVAERFAESCDHRILQLDVRDLGLARNAAARDARGRYIAFMDGDDLPSRNWVRDGFAFGESLAVPAVMHPAMNYMFGAGDTYVYLHRDMDDPEYVPAALIAENYWTAITMARRDVYLDIPYEPNLLKYGLAYEDWSWNALTISRGVTHKIVPGTAHYIRRKAQGSLLQQTVQSGSLPRLGHLRDADMHTQASP